MQQIVECVPNFSEGRRAEVLDEIVRAMTDTGVLLLDREMDASHNRAVVTIAGEPDAVAEAAFRGCAQAAELIDLNTHRGEHPRMGATDVIPFIPIRNVTMEDCIQLARRVGERIGRELEIPVYLYERAATHPERRDLAYVRRGEYEAIREEIATSPEREPDFGPRRVGKAGAVAVGARPFLIAYNVNLATNDLQIAKDIAKVTRERGGGLPSVKALGFALEVKGIVQVSMNLTDFNVTGMLTAFNHVRAEAEKRGVQVLGSELVGLVPLEALTQIAREALQLEGFNSQQVVEVRLQEASIDE
ncbi:MAG TPA: glutamate formimidoyltransferase [Anaerolineae bacterium]|nr:glutamate formimidoyltransferase [Anaerolineae bacterium]